MRTTLILIWLCGLALLAGVIALSWNSNPYWMDAGGYAAILAADRWVVHPPGHILFVAAGRLLHAVGFADCVVSAGMPNAFHGNPEGLCRPPEVAIVFANSYTTLQVLTLLLTLAGMLSLYRLLREVLDSLQSSLLVFASALSWIPLLINHAGTSHASDFLTTPLLLWAAVRVTTRPTRSATAALALAIVLSGGFRLTTFIMMGPLLLAVLWVNRRKPSVWVACAVGGLLLALLQLLVIRVTGGWATYFGWAAKMNVVNRTYCVIHSGFTRLALFNLSRTLIWFGLATIGLWFALPRLRSPQPWKSKQRVLLVYGALATAGPLAVCALYLCEHPGYLAPALAGFYLCVAVGWDRADGRPSFAKWPIVAMLVSLLLFFGMHYYRDPSTRGQALANCLLLQFSADGARHAFYVTSSDWLTLAEFAGVSGKRL